MSDELVTVTLPLTYQGLLGAVLLLILFVAILLALAGDGIKPARDPAIRALKAFAWVYGIVWLVIFVGTLQALWSSFTGASSPLAGGEIGSLGLGALITALLGAPFVIWGTVLKQKNTDIQNRLVNLNDAGLFNDKLAVSVDSLYARRQVTRVVGSGDNVSVLTEWEDDILKRSAAIDRLESLVVERPTEAERIASMLAIYARELSRQQESISHTRLDVLKLVNPADDSMPLEWEEALHELNAHPDSAELDEFKIWAQNIVPWRADVEKAVQVLGRLNTRMKGTSVHLKFDLRKTNLQGFDLARSNFSGCDFSKCIAHGVNFSGSNLEGALFDEAEIGGAVFRNANCKKTQFRFSKADGAIFVGAKMDDARVSFAQMEGVDFTFAYLSDVEFTKGSLNHSFFHQAVAKRTHFSDTSLSFVSFTSAELTDSVFENTLCYNSDFSNSFLSGVRFHEVKMNDQVRFWGADLSGASFKNMKLPMLGNTFTCDDEGIIDETFGDRSVGLPDTVNVPQHWPLWDFDDIIFLQQWRKWQDEGKAYIPPKPD